MTFEEINTLGQILDSTWGRGSTNNPRGASQSVKAKMAGEDKLILTYTSIVNFGEPQERTREFQVRKNDSTSILNACVKKIKDDFKEMADRSLTVEEINDEEDWHLLNLGQYSGRKDAYYIRNVVFRVE